MKVLHIINSLATGGAEKLILETIPLYKENGVTADLLVLDGTLYPFLAKLQSLNCCRIYSINLGSIYNPLNIIKIIPFLRWYDVVHVHLFPVQYWAVLAKLLSFSKVKLVFTEHSSSNRRNSGNFLLAKLDSYFYRSFNKIICITNEVFEVLSVHTKLSPDNFEIIPNGINLHAIKTAQPIPKEKICASIEESDRIIIQVSSFQEPKDQRTVIKSLTLLPETVKLVLVGDGPLKAESEKLAERLQVDKRVVFLGLRMDVPALLKASDVVVLSSKYEGLSLASIEGMASGRPFVASEVPGLREIVSNAGVLFEAGNHRALAKQITALLTDKILYKNTIEACQKRASQFDIYKMVDRYVDLYKKVLSKN